MEIFCVGSLVEVVIVPYYLRSASPSWWEIFFMELILWWLWSTLNI